MESHTGGKCKLKCRWRAHWFGRVEVVLAARRLLQWRLSRRACGRRRERRGECGERQRGGGGGPGACGVWALLHREGRREDDFAEGLERREVQREVQRVPPGAEWGDNSLGGHYGGASGSLDLGRAGGAGGSWADVGSGSRCGSYPLLAAHPHDAFDCGSSRPPRHLIRLERVYCTLLLLVCGNGDLYSREREREESGL